MTKCVDNAFISTLDKENEQEDSATTSGTNRKNHIYLVQSTTMIGESLTLLLYVIKTMINST